MDDPLVQRSVMAFTQAIRDIRSSPYEAQVSLATSLDKSLVMINHKANAAIHSFQLEHAGWSCCFHPSQEYLIAAGTSQNTVEQFDIRNPNTRLSVCQVPWSKGKGIHSLVATETEIFGACFGGLFRLSQPDQVYTYQGALTCLDVHQDQFLSCWKTNEPSKELYCLSDFPNPLFDTTKCLTLDPKTTMLKKSKCFQVDDKWIQCIASRGLYYQDHFIPLPSLEYQKGNKADQCLIAGAEQDAIKIWRVNY